MVAELITAREEQDKYVELLGELGGGREQETKCIPVAPAKRRSQRLQKNVKLTVNKEPEKKTPPVAKPRRESSQISDEIFL